MALLILFWVWQCILLILFWVWQWLYSYCFEFDNGFIHTVLSLTMALFIQFWVWQWLYSYCFEFDNGFIHTVLSLTMHFIHTVLSLTMALFILFWVWQWLYSYCFEFDNALYSYYLFSSSSMHSAIKSAAFPDPCRINTGIHFSNTSTTTSNVFKSPSATRTTTGTFMAK